MSLRTLSHQGRTWTVWDVVPEASTVAAVEPEYSAGWLVFQSAEEKRRFAPAPPGWSEFSDRDLGVLLHSSVPVASRLAR